jgi:predicted DNA-binding protein
MPIKKRFDAQISVPLPIDMRARLSEIADKKGTTSSQLIREAIKTYIDKEDREEKRLSESA